MTLRELRQKATSRLVDAFVARTPGLEAPENPTQEPGVRRQLAERLGMSRGRLYAVLQGNVELRTLAKYARQLDDQELGDALDSVAAWYDERVERVAEEAWVMVERNATAAMEEPLPSPAS